MLNCKEYNEFKEKLNALFTDLRTTYSIIARQNFSCCRSCAGCELGQKLDEYIAKNKFKRGAVFYTRQCNENLGDGFVYISYFGKDYTTEQIGECVVESANKVGLTVDWDHRPSTCIKLLAPALASPIFT